MGKKFSCGPFDLDGLATDNDVYPLPWKFAKFFIALGFVIMTLTTFLTLATFCRQSIMGKSIHTVTGSAQAVAGNAYFQQMKNLNFTNVLFVWFLQRYVYWSHCFYIRLDGDMVVCNVYVALIQKLFGQLIAL